MLEHVWRRTRAAGCFDRVLVATDSDRVAGVAGAFGAEVVHTGTAPSGTARAALAVGDASASVVVVQADQPLVDPAHLRRLVRGLAAGGVVTLAAPGRGDPTDPARVKVTLDPEGLATAFTRRWHGLHAAPWLVHVGLYGFGPHQLARCAALPRSRSSVDEDLEQLAWLDAGVPIRAIVVDVVAQSVDTPEDLATVRGVLARLLPEGS